VKRVGLNDPAVRETMRVARLQEHPKGRGSLPDVNLPVGTTPDNTPPILGLDRHEKFLTLLTGTLAAMYDALWIEEVVSHPTCSLTGYSIMEEVVEKELDGTLPPFVPGPLGAYEFVPGPAQVTDAELKTIHNRWREQDQKALRELRAKNDATLASLEAAL
jgi:hypothetical protein